MRILRVKINLNHLRRDIDSNYPRFRELFYRALVANLAAYNMLHGIILNTTVIEDSHFNQLLLYLANSGVSLQEVIGQIDSDIGKFMYADTSVYVEDFLRHHHNPKSLNLYSCELDETYHLVITNRQIPYAG